MKLITERDVIRGALEEWNRLHNYADIDVPYEREVRKRLEALDLETATAEQIGEIIGNNEWIIPWCWDCAERHGKAWIQLGEDDVGEYEDPVYLCASCAQQAVSMLLMARAL